MFLLKTAMSFLNKLLIQFCEARIVVIFTQWTVTDKIDIQPVLFESIICSKATLLSSSSLSSLSSSLLLSSSAFSRWDNSRTLWAIKLIFYMNTCHDYVLWIRIREPFSFMQTGPTSQISIFGKKFHDGLTWPIFIRFGSNLVQRSLVSLWTETECLKWLRPFFDLPAQPTKIDV